jgi:hypothetical protein
MYSLQKNHYLLDGLKIEIIGDKKIIPNINIHLVNKTIHIYQKLEILLLDTRMISFKTYDFGTYALLNDRHAHMPFQSWRMRPKSLNHLLFTLNTQSFEITFEIRVSSAAFYLCIQDLYLYKILSRP